MAVRTQAGRWTVALVSACLLVGVAAAEIAPPAQIAVSPSRFELQIGAERHTESLRLVNFSNREVEVKVTVATWKLDERNRVVLVEPDEQSLDQWLVINPLRFKVGPRDSQTVRFSIRPRVEPEPGEHRAMIYLEEVLPPDPNATMRVRFKVGVAVYGHAGEILRLGELKDLSVVEEQGRHRARFDIASEGSAHVRMSGQFALWRAGDFPGVAETALLEDLGQKDFVVPEPILIASRLPSTPVLPGTERTVVLDFARGLPPGDYVLDVNGDLGGEPLDEAVTFTVAEKLPPEPEEDPGPAASPAPAAGAETFPVLARAATGED
jgi:hypothetical protein